MINDLIVLGEKTKKELNIDYKKLSFDSHQLIYVQCCQCQEIFQRPFRNLKQKHQCPDYPLNTKKCASCNRYLSSNRFIIDNNNFDDFSPSCCECTDYIRGDGELIKLSQMFNVPHDVILDLYRRQHGKCFLTNQALYQQCFTQKEYQLISKTLSLIKLDPTNAFESGNIAIVIDGFKNNSKNLCRIEVKIENSNGRLPYRKRITDAGYDIYSSESIIIPSRGIATVNSGIIVCPPEGFYCTVDGRSSLWSLGIIPFRGIIDATYQGLLKVTLLNVADSDYEIKVGARIAQLIVHEINHIDFVVVDNFSPVREGRLTDGFGSSGK